MACGRSAEPDSIVSGGPCKRRFQCPGYIYDYISIMGVKPYHEEPVPC
jgi:hypothetical protein